MCFNPSAIDPQQRADFLSVYKVSAISTGIIHSDMLDENHESIFRVFHHLFHFFRSILRYHESRDHCF